MVSIEQGTKRRFVESTQDKLVEGNEEDDIEEDYTLEHVQKLEAEATRSKAILREGMELVGSVRKEIESLTDELHLFDVLKKDLGEAKELSNGIKEMEEELKRLKGSKSGNSTDAFKRGSLTREEAEEKVNTQVSL